MTLDREVAGITCRQVLTALGDYVDGELGDAERAGVEAHLRGCTTCERFGGAIGAMVSAVRRSLADPLDVAADVAARLDARLAREPPGR